MHVWIVYIDRHLSRIGASVMMVAVLAALGLRLNHSQNATRTAIATAERKFLASLS